MAKKQLSYLERIQFDPALLKGAVAGYLSNFRIVILAIITIILAGLISYFELPKRLNPEVEIPIVSVVTVLPGASPEDVESLVTIPLEEKLQNAKGLDEMVSVSNNSVSVVTLTFVSDVSRDKAKDDTQALVDTVSDLPEDAESPSVAAFDFEDQPIWTFALSSDGDIASLMNFADQLATDLEETSIVDRVERTGFENKEVVVELRPEIVSRYGLSPFVLAQSIGRSTASFPAGQVNTGQNSFSLSLNPAVDSLSSLRELPINLQGESVSLGEIATIKEQAVPDQSTTWVADHQNPAKRAVTFYVYKTSAASIDRAGHEVKELVEAKLAERDQQFTLTTISNASEQIEEQFTDLVGEFRSTILLVFACLLLFLGLRQAFISSFTVPLTFLSAFVLMRFIGMSINFLSLFAFLLALGLLVDDTIVVVSTMTSYFKTRKFTPFETGLVVWRDTIVPIWSTTLTTIWSFVPLLLSTGIIGEFIKPIPIVVTITMISSTAIAVLITLPIMMVVLKPQFATRVVIMMKVLAVLALLVGLVAISWGNPLLPLIVLVFVLFLITIQVTGKQVIEKAQSFWHRSPAATRIGNGIRRITDHGLIDLEGVSHKYYRLIMRVLSSRSARFQVIAAIVIYSVISFALLPLGLVKNEFFPKEDVDTLYLNVELPSGTNLAQAEQAGVDMLNQVREIEGIEYTVAEIAQQFSENGGRSDDQGSFLLSLRLLPKEERSFTSIELAQQLRDRFAEYEKGQVSIVEVSGGPPAGADVQITLLGD
jgi:multidrug efflux pump subunit AcrB